MTAQPECTAPGMGPGGLPGWMHPPRDEGWIAEDLDKLPEAPRHTELIDGALVFMMSPQRSWHGQTVTSMTVMLKRQAPEGTTVEREMTVKLDRYNRPEPDVLFAPIPFESKRTCFAASDVALAVEVVSPESAHRDRKVKPGKYAGAGIAHFWRVENEDDVPVVHTYERDATTGLYAPTGVFRKRLEVSLPFPISADLERLLPTMGLG